MVRIEHDTARLHTYKELFLRPGWGIRLKAGTVYQARGVRVLGQGPSQVVCMFALYSSRTTKEVDE